MKRINIHAFVVNARPGILKNRLICATMVTLADVKIEKMLQMFCSLGIRGIDLGSSKKG